MLESAEYLNIKQASVWATAHIGKTVTSSNIAYLINYDRVPKIGDNGGTLIAKQDLIDYYENYQREAVWKKQLGNDLNWEVIETFDFYNRYKHIKSENIGDLCSAEKNLKELRFSVGL